MEIIIFFIWLIGFGLLMFGLNKSRNVYKSLYAEINKEEITKDYQKIKQLLEETEDIKEKKLLNERINKLYSYYEIDDSEIRSTILSRDISNGEKIYERQELLKYLLKQFDSAFQIKVSGIVFLIIGMVLSTILTMHDPTPFRIFGMSLFLSTFLLSFLAIKFDKKRKIVILLTVLIILFWISSVILLVIEKL